jgi:hypothetical protein
MVCLVCQSTKTMVIFDCTYCASCANPVTTTQESVVPTPPATSTTPTTTSPIVVAVASSSPVVSAPPMQETPSKKLRRKYISGCPRTPENHSTFWSPRKGKSKIAFRSSSGINQLQQPVSPSYSDPGTATKPRSLGVFATMEDDTDDEREDCPPTTLAWEEDEL